MSGNSTEIIDKSYWPKKPGTSRMYWVLRYPIVALLRLLYRVKFTGLENIPKSGPAILAPNHISAFDPIFILMGMPRRVTAMGNARFFRGKNGWFFKAMGQIPIIPGDDDSRDKAIACSAEIVRQEEITAIFPEGNRSRDGKLHRGRTGVGHLAQTTGAPVIPIGVIGSYEVLPKGKTWPRFFRRVAVHIGEPMYLHDTDKAAVRPFVDELMEQIAKLSGQEYEDTYTEERSK